MLYYCTRATTRFRAFPIHRLAAASDGSIART